MRRKTTTVYKRPFPWEYVLAMILVAPILATIWWVAMVLLFQ